MDEEVKPLSEEGEASPSLSVPVEACWSPRQLVFRPYSPLQDSNRRGRALRVVVRSALVARLTQGIVETYEACNSEFKYPKGLNPKRCLTSPADGVLNDGHDNANSDLILYTDDVLVNSQRCLSYIVKDALGHGTFGQVAKCWVPETNSFVALKIIKNQPAYYQQALVEVSILTTLSLKFDPEDKHHIVRIYDHFVFQRHLCISFELLDMNLYELVKHNKFGGLSVSLVQFFSKQILCGLTLMKDAGIIHCDLKPENILLRASAKPPQVKIIDFGSACMENQTIYSYIQSRYYRSPEVVLGYQYSTAIDMWSFGCIVAELFLGIPLFPGQSEFDLLKKMIKILGGQPPDYVLKDAKNTNKFFKYVGNISHVGPRDISNGRRSSYQALTAEEYEFRDKKKVDIGKEYFNYMDLEGIVAAYPYRENLSEEGKLKEMQIRLALIDFLKGLVEFDPAKRWSPLQASNHPFLTGEPFTGPYNPPKENPYVPASQNFKVAHHPGAGHWFAAGLSPNISGRNVTMQTSLLAQMVPNSYGSSYSSLGSYGDCTGFNISHGSSGDNFNTFAYYSPGGPSGMNIYTQGVTMVGSSPDARRRMMHHSQGFGASPSTAGFAPLPLGTSPSQHTPPSSYTYIPGSPGHYESTSPARSCFQGSPLGKGVAASQFSRRKNWGFSGNMPSQEGLSSSNWQGQRTDGIGSIPSDSTRHDVPINIPPHMSSSSTVTSWRQSGGGAPVGAGYPFPIASSFSHGPTPQFSHNKRTANDKHETGLPLPDPGDWDPHYSDAQLLEEGGFVDSFIASEFNYSLNINQAPASAEKFIGVGRFSQEFNGRFTNLVQRPNAPLQASSLPHMNHNSSRRLGQQPIQQFGHGGSAALNTRVGIQSKLQQPLSFNTMAPISSVGSSSNKGKKPDKSAPKMPLPSHGRNDYDRTT